MAEPLAFTPTSTPPPSPLTHTLSHLTPGTQYSAHVSCRNKVGVSFSFPSSATECLSHNVSPSQPQLSDWSTEVVFTTSPGTPSPPLQPAVTKLTSHSAQLQWMVSFGPAEFWPSPPPPLSSTMLSPCSLPPSLSLLRSTAVQWLVMRWSIVCWVVSGSSCPQAPCVCVRYRISSLPQPTASESRYVCCIYMYTCAHIHVRACIHKLIQE